MRRNRFFILASFILMAGFLLLAGCDITDTTIPKDKSVSVQRYRELRKVIDKNTGNAHFTRGVNSQTIIALRDSVTDADIPVLKALLNDDDHVTRLAAGYVLSIMGEKGVAAMKEAKTDLNGSDIEDAIGRAEETSKSVEETRKYVEEQRRNKELPKK